MRAGLSPPVVPALLYKAHTAIFIGDNAVILVSLDFAIYTAIMKLLRLLILNNKINRAGWGGSPACFYLTIFKNYGIIFIE